MTSPTVLDVVEIAGPVGDLLVVASPEGVVRVAFLAVEPADEVLEVLAAQVSPIFEERTRPTSRLRRVFDDYFSRRTADVGTPVDLRLAHGFRREALVALRGVPAGTTVAYRELAELAGRPRAVRAAASACATNPVPIVVPCHRVVRSDGTLGAYGPGQPAKRTLLALEGVVVPG